MRNDMLGLLLFSKVTYSRILGWIYIYICIHSYIYKNIYMVWFLYLGTSQTLCFIQCQSHPCSHVQPITGVDKEDS